MIFKLFEIPNDIQVLVEQCDEDVIIKAHIPLLDICKTYCESSITFNNVEEAQLFFQRIDVSYIHDWLQLQEEMG